MKRAHAIWALVLASTAVTEPLRAEAGVASSPAFVNFDFVPGERIMFAEDFSRDTVGDFPRRLQLINGNAEVSEFQGRRWLRIPNDLTVAIPLSETLPQRFTVEFEYHAVDAAWGELHFSEQGLDGYAGGKPRALFVRDEEGSRGGIEFEDGRSSIGQVAGGLRHTFPVRIMVDGKHVKMYVAGTRVANAPSFELGRSRKITMHFSDRLATYEGGYLTGIRIAAGGRDLYDALNADGRVALQGILFDTGSDRIRPESMQTLTDIGNMLKAHGDLRVRIEGHTDDVGDDLANKQLSARRATAVQAWLIQNAGINAARLVPAGVGEERPVAPNQTPEGRQQNRRVELIRI